MSKANRVDEKYIREENMDDLWNVWYSELHNGSSGITLKIDNILESTKSEFQRIEVIENRDFGKMLVLYGSLMVADNDNHAYNEMITHIPLFVHPAPSEVLIIGGGDCGALTEVTKHSDVKRVTMCEIDEKVVEVSKKHFPDLTQGLNDPRSNLIISDGKHYLEEYDGKFDLVLLDLSDPIGPAADLFQKSFHQTVYDRLNDDGIMVAQSESPFYNKETVKAMYENLREIFPIVRMYTCFMPIYPSALWSFAFCSKKFDPLKDFRRDKFDDLNLSLQYYNDDVHFGSFMQPEFVRNILDKA